MATRGCIKVIDFNGKVHFRYNHWDSYPMGLGVLLVNVVRDGKIDEFLKEKIDAHNYDEHDCIWGDVEWSYTMDFKRSKMEVHTGAFSKFQCMLTFDDILNNKMEDLVGMMNDVGW